MNFLDSIACRAMSVRAPALQSTKAPQGALATTGWQNPTQPIYETYSAEAAIRRVYEGNVYAYRCVDAIANSIVSCPFRAGDAVSNNFKLNFPLARLLGPAPGSPNPAWSSALMLRYSIASYVLMGKFAWAIERDSVRRIVGLWPLRAQHVRPVPATQGTNYFSLFRYGEIGQPGYREYLPDEIVYIWRPALRDFREPESPVNVAGLNISVAKLLDMFDYSFLKNGGVPAHLLVTPPFANETDREAFQAQFEADFGGATNAGRTMFAERLIEGEGPTNGIESVDVKVIGTTQRDAEINNLRKAENTAISIAFGVPLSILGDSTAVTFSNAFQDRRNYWLETLLPKAREIQDGINTYLAPKLDPTEKIVGWFDTSGVPELRPEPAIPEQVAVEWIRAGLVKVDEVRADRGLPPAKDVGLSGEIAELAAPPLQPAAPGSLEKQAGNVVPPAKAPVATAPAASRSVYNCRHPGHDHRPVPTGHLTISVLEKVLTGQIRNLMAEQEAAVRQRLTSRRPSRDVFDAEFWETRTVLSLSPVLEEIGLTFSQIVDISRDMTSETRNLVNSLNVEDYGSRDDMLDSVSGLFDFRHGPIVEAARAKLREGQVPVDEVEKALVGLSNGTMTVNAALAAWGVTQ